MLPEQKECSRESGLLGKNLAIATMKGYFCGDVTSIPFLMRGSTPFDPLDSGRGCNSK
jgi:hypothetical protein